MQSFEVLNHEVLKPSVIDVLHGMLEANFISECEALEYDLARERFEHKAKIESQGEDRLRAKGRRLRAKERRMTFLAFSFNG